MIDDPSFGPNLRRRRLARRLPSGGARRRGIRMRERAGRAHGNIPDLTASGYASPGLANPEILCRSKAPAAPPSSGRLPRVASPVARSLAVRLARALRPSSFPARAADKAQRQGRQPSEVA